MNECDIIYFDRSGVTETWYRIWKESYGSELFIDHEFHYYFVTEAELRKYKLENLANERDIQKLFYGE